MELMVVVLMMGILAALGMYSYDSDMVEARNTEGLAVLRAISAAQEAYRAENQVYKSIGSDVSSATSGFYPPGTPGMEMLQFWGWGGDEAEWQELAPEVPTLVQYRFRTKAGLPGETPTGFLNVTGVAFPATVEPWYTVEAWGDNDGNGCPNVMIVTSFNTKVHHTNRTERCPRD